MKHRVAGRKLGRTSAHRLALLRNLSTSLFRKERITTTLMKAKELRPFAEKLLTLAKRETLHARRQVLRHIHDLEVVSKMFDTFSARYAQRPGGYTRIIKLGPRRGDAAEMAIVELVDSEDLKKKKAEEPAKGKKGKAEKPKAEKAATPAEKGEKAAKGEKKPAARKKAARPASEKTGKAAKGAKKPAGPTKGRSRSGE